MQELGVLMLLRVQSESARLTPGRTGFAPRMKKHRPFVSTLLAVPLAAAIIGLGPLLAHEAAAPAEHEELDTEHIFGFTEGAYIGEKGEKEIENTAVERFGKSRGYSYFENETAFRSVIPDNIRFSFGTIVDGYAIQNGSGLSQRTGGGFDGVIGEVRWQPLERSKGSPLDLTLSFSPEWRRVDDATGAEANTYSGQTAILAVAAIDPDKLFVGFNFIYEPAVTRVFDGWQNDSSVEVSLAASYAIAPNIFVGAEVRHLNGSEQGLLSSHALYFGPSLYAKLSDTLAVKVTWSEQVPDGPNGRLDLENFERHQALLLLVKTF
jgi:hypothetical protein